MTVYVLISRDNPHIGAGNVEGVYSTRERAQEVIDGWCKVWEDRLADDEQAEPMPDIPDDELCYIVACVVDKADYNDWDGGMT